MIIRYFLACSQKEKEICVKYKHLFESEINFCTCINTDVIHSSCWFSFFHFLFLLFFLLNLGAAVGCFIRLSKWYVIYWNLYFGSVFILMPVGNFETRITPLDRSCNFKAIISALLPSHNKCLWKHSIHDSNPMKFILELTLWECLLHRNLSLDTSILAKLFFVPYEAKVGNLAVIMTVIEVLLV